MSRARRPEALLAVALAACAPTRALAPLPKGEGAITLSIGGPVLDVAGAPLPLPLSTVGYVYGVDGRTNVHAAIFPTQILLFGVFGADAGVSRELLRPDGARPRLMIDGTLTLFSGDLAPDAPPGGTRLFPEVSLVAAWPRARLTPYVGIDLFTQIFPSARFYPTPVVGAEWLPAPGLGLQLDLGWVAPWQGTDTLATHWYGFDRHGALTLKLGVNVYPKGKRATAEAG